MRRPAALWLACAIGLAACNGETNLSDPSVSTPSSLDESTASSTEGEPPPTTGEPADPPGATPPPATPPPAATPPPGPTTSLAPFEPQPTTPARPGDDLDEILRAEQTTTTTSAPPPLADGVDRPLPTLDAQPLAWTLRRPVDETATVIEILIDETDCDGSLASADRLTVSVTETQRAVTIGVQRDERVSGPRVRCPAAPLTPWTVELSSPLGQRTLAAADESTVPPTPDPANSQLAIVRTTSSGAVSRSSIAGDDPDLRLRLDCPAVDSSVDRSWDPTVEFGSPEVALGDGAAALDRERAAWHELVLTTETGALHQWVVIDARPPDAATDARAVVVAVVTARPGVVGWSASGTACGGPIEQDGQVSDVSPVLPQELSPDAARAEAPAFDLVEALGGVAPDGTAVAGDDLVFVDPQDRCVGWTALEDALLELGAELGNERTVVDRDEFAEASAGVANGASIAVTRQVSRRVALPDGSAVTLTTDADGRVTISSTLTRAAPASSRLAPCRLDAGDGLIRLIAA
ncbi:MAG: hypothetical protein AAGG08_00045 [Actinomycetota bacterium]